MNLLFVADYFPLRGSGVFRIHDFIFFSKSSDITVSIVSRLALSDILKVKAGEDINNLKIYRALSLDLRLGEVVPDLFQAVSTFSLCFVLILLGDFDFVYISVPPGVPGIGAFFAAKLLRRKIVFDVRDRWEDHSIFHSKYRLAKFTHVFFKGLFDILYRRANLVVSVTPSLVTYLKAKGCAKVVLIPNGADVKLFHPRSSSEKSAIRSELGLNGADVILVYAGGIGAYYRIDIVIKAIYHLIQAKGILHVKLVIMGRGESSKVQEMLELIQNLALERNVAFLGEHERGVVSRILACCDVGVVPYDDSALWTSAYSTKFFEYCSTGLPVIATVKKGSDLADLVERNRVGYVVEPLNIVQFASAIEEYCSLSEKRKKDLSDRARSLAVNSFDRRRITEKLLETLQGA